MKKLLAACSAALVFGAASAHELTYDITATWFEPMTQPKNTIFKGSFVYNENTNQITGMTGMLSESMTGMSPAMMAWIPLTNELAGWYDAALGGTYVAVFKNANTATFFGNTWTPADGLAVGDIAAGFPVKAANPGNAYALVFVPEVDPTKMLTQAQLDGIAYADCTPTSPMGMMKGGGMMGNVCMTGTSLSVYGQAGTMDAYPFSQSITLAPVPEADTLGMMAAGMAIVAAISRRRRFRA